MAQLRIFGNENAEKDPLLLDCYVPHANGCEQIITGRWGTGKTAYLFNRNRILIDALKELNVEQDRLWYVDEDELYTDQIIDSFLDLKTRKFLRYLKSIWMAEIYRRAAILLAELAPLYSNTEGLHWDLVKSISKADTVGKTIWKQIPNALKVLKTLDEKQITAVEGIQKEFSAIFEDKTIKYIQKCLKDIEGHNIQPVVAIEPIETPLSEIEKSSLAQEVISSLLNVFQSEFQPGAGQRLEVLISVPWHRFSNKHINLPQKITQYILYLHWTQEMLKTFINKRIEWEFNRVNRSFSTKGDVDAWSLLFNDYVHNDYCKPSINESSFAYLLRHTHYRPREVQRITRMAVETCSRRIGRPIDDILKGIGGIKVDGSHLREAISDYTKKATDDLVSETTRRFPPLKDIFAWIKGLTVPFASEDLSSRLPEDISVASAIEMLWESGLLGIEVTCKKQEYLPEFKHLLPDRNCARNINKTGKELVRWYFFEYNCDGDASEIREQFRLNEKLDVKLIFHPRTYESMSAHVSSNWPYGI